MAEVSNKALAILLVGAIVISLAGTLISINKVSQISSFSRRGNQITGMALQDNGNVSLTIQGGAALAVKRGINFGTVNPNGSIINISSEVSLIGRGGSNDCSVVANCSGLEIENDGNIPINVTMNSSSNASDLIGGTGANWTFFVANGNSSNTGNATRPDGGCTMVPPIYNSNAWTNFQKNTNYIICNSSVGAGLWYNDTNDTITIEVNLTIPSDAATGIKTAVLSFYNDP
jgi:hypothetical protein